MITRALFASQLVELEREMTQMGDMVIEAVQKSTEVFLTNDRIQAQKIIDDDERINQKRWHIENLCNHLIATQQPVATNLREIIAVLNIISELERMADHAKGNAKIVTMIDDTHLTKIKGFQKLTDITINMLSKSLEAFLKRDPELASKIIDEDDQVDALSRSLVKDLLKLMVRDPKTVEASTFLIWSVHNLERIADRVTNICERVIYLVTGSTDF